MERAQGFGPNFYTSVIRSCKYLYLSRTDEVHYGISEALFFLIPLYNYNLVCLDLFHGF